MALFGLYKTKKEKHIEHLEREYKACLYFEEDAKRDQARRGYNKSASLEDIIRKYEIKTLRAAEDIYAYKPTQYAKEYITSLGTVSKRYFKNNEIAKALELQEKALSLTEKLYSQNTTIWASYYIESLMNLAMSCSQNNQLDISIDLSNKALNIIEPLYSGNTYLWAEFYVILLSRLATFYRNIEQIINAIEIEEKNLTLTKRLYEASANPRDVAFSEYRDTQISRVWLSHYVRSLQNNIMLYLANNQIEETFELANMLIKLSSNLSRQETEEEKELYIALFDVVYLAYYKNNYMEKALLAATKSFGIHEYYYGRSDSRTQKRMNMLTSLEEEYAQNEKQTQDATFTDLLYLAKFVADVNEKDVIDMESFIKAFGFIKLNNKIKQELLNGADVDEVPHLENGLRYINKAKELPKMLYDDNLKSLTERAKTLFDNNESIGIFR